METPQRDYKINIAGPQHYSAAYQPANGFPHFGYSEAFQQGMGRVREP